MSFFEFDKWDSSPFIVGFQISLFWGFFVFEYEHTLSNTPRPWLPCILTQWGGDHLYYWSFGWFRRSITFYIWEFDYEKDF